MDVLIVEDDPGVQRLMTRSLEKAGFMVKAVENGLAALAELREAEFRAIVCDVGLPFLEGKSFYQHLKSEYPGQAQRVLFVTGMANDPATKAFLDASGQPYLGKPVELADFLKAVRHIVSTAVGPPPRAPRG